VPFDTLRFARHLEESGMAASVATGAAEAFADALTGAELVTRSDLTESTRELRSELRTEITAVRTEIATTRNEVAATRTELKNDIELLRRDITIKFGSMLVIAVGILLTAIRYLPPHP
jgi:hypothetical protein